ncbi:outer membrane protein assembly factor BamB family protein [Krasilnikoviella flava]|uniref:PQQ-like domain-containing protein n=1 Tax=Krasilnikoviella flava TaxID=526729 RepID=A0A1T5K257_9MICO|nr:PQQ-binding-like beta-propeller repeat protein [Krasilnikoviella flava]SKC57569.1 PQQ-like domain-containing protein [Krasilnikoviella flava]
MARRRGARPDAYTFDLDPDGIDQDGNEPDGAGDGEAGPVVRATYRAGTRGPLLIDLDPVEDADDDPDDLAPPPGADDVLTWRRAADRVRDALRGRRLAAAVVLVAVTLTAVVVDTVGDRGRLAALRSAPGGVLDLTDQPREVWRVAAEGDAPGGLMGVLGGLVVAQHRDALLGLDVETGERRWEVDLPGSASSCGPGMQVWSGGFQPEAVDRIVCVTQAPAADDGAARHSTVTVVGADGSVEGSREVEGSPSELYPGADGGLVTVDWVGEASPVDPHVADDVVSGIADEGAIPDGYDLRVRVEDAITGELRWDDTVRFDAAVDPSLCVRWSDDGTTSGVDLRGGVQAMVTDRVLWLGGCGIDAWFTPEGVRLDRPDDPGTFDGFSVEPFTDGGYVVRTDADGLGARDPADADRLLRDDGTEVREVRGRYLVPLSTDGGGEGVHLERRGGATVGTDADGDERWRTDVRSTSLLVRTSQVAVVVDEGRRVYGLDLGTGEVLWVRPDLVEGLDAMGAYGPRFVDAAFTDGRLAAFVVPDYARGDVVHWVALDAVSGRQLWQVELGGDGWGVQLAVAGRLVRWSPTEIVGLG